MIKFLLPVLVLAGLCRSPVRARHRMHEAAAHAGARSQHGSHTRVPLELLAPHLVVGLHNVVVHTVAAAAKNSSIALDWSKTKT